jgi:Xaa-Pro aminopeptidase
MAQAASAAADAGLAGILATPGPDLVYLTGYSPPAATERLTAFLLIRDRPPTVIVPTLERPDAERAPAALELVGWADGSDPYEAAAAHLDPSGRYAISDSAWAMHVLGLQRALPGSSYVSMTEGLPMLRAVKSPHELERMAAAGAAADAAFTDLLGVRFAGRTERALAADLTDLLLRNGHSSVEFAIVGSGPNGANPHHEASDRVIETGDIVVLDFGGFVDGYGSDTTRAVSVGEPSEDAVRVHDVVRRAQQAGFDAVKPGIACEEIDRAARNVIEAEGLAERFLHRTGHGIGLTTHEPPYIVEGERRPLEPGMCFSIEPGIYLAGDFGVRIEDIVTVTEDGGKRLNTTPRDLHVVE